MNAHSNANKRARVAAACVSSDATDIMPLLIAHYIAQGIHDFYLVFHNDDPSASRGLVASLGNLANFTIYHHNFPIFNQAAITNMLLELARADGCDVLMPFDSDEFYEPTDSSRSLTDVLDEWVSEGPGEQILVPMYNYFAPRDTEHFTPRTLERMSHRVDMKQGFAQDDLNSRFWWLYKSISRLNGIPKAHFTNITIGNHQTLRGRDALEKSLPDTPRAPTPPDTFPLVIRHIPWRSRDFTVRPLLMDRALITSVRSGDGLDEAELAQLFADTWDAYSLEPDIDVAETYETETYFLVPDETCARILRTLDEAGFDIDDPWMRPRDGAAISRQSSPATGNGAVGGNFVSRIEIDDPAFDAGVMASNAQLHRAYQERDFQRERLERKDERIARLEARIHKLTEQLESVRERIKRLRATNDALRETQPVAGSEPPPALPSSRWSPLGIARRARRRIRSWMTRP